MLAYRLQIDLLRAAIVATMLAVLLPLATTAAFQTPSQVIAIQPPLNYQGHTFTVEYKAAGDYRRPDANLFFVATPDFFEKHGIVGLNVRQDGVPVKDEDVLRRVFTLYTAAYLLYERPAPDSPYSIPPGFRDDLQKVTQNPIFIDQQIKALFKSPYEENLEAMRGILTFQGSPAQVEVLAQQAQDAKNVEKFAKFTDVLQGTLDAMRFSNSSAVRKFPDEVRTMFKDWVPISEKNVAYIKVDNTHKLPLSEALQIASLGIKLLWVADLNQERAQWLQTYGASFTQGNAAMNADQSRAASAAGTESRSAWAQRADIVLSFAKERAANAVVSLAAEKLASEWVKHSWQSFGTRTMGHWVAGAASAAGLGLTLGDLLYGLDDLVDNFRKAERSDELRVRFQTGRLALQNQVKRGSKSAYNGELAETYRAAYMLEYLAAAQSQRSYADGVAATVRNDLLGKLNPINWFKGGEWRAAVEGLQKLADADEQTAEDTIGHPHYIDAAIDLALKSDTTVPPTTSVTTATVLALDVSSSMAWPDPNGKAKMDDLKNAARMLINMIRAESQTQGIQHRIGLITFNQAAATLLSLSSDWDKANSVIDSLVANGDTNIAQALANANTELKSVPSNQPHLILLLTDGVPTRQLSGAQGSDFESLRQEILQGPVAESARSKNCIYTVGFGGPDQPGNTTPSYDPAFLRAISQGSGCGQSYEAKNANELANVYIKFRHQSLGTVLGEFTGTVQQGQRVLAGGINVPTNQSALYATLNWPGSTLELDLTDPQGRLVDRNYPGASFNTTPQMVYLIVQNPTAGKWSASVQGVDVPEGVTSFNAILSTRTGTISATPPGSSSIYLPTPTNTGNSQSTGLAIGIIAGMVVLGLIGTLAVGLSRQSTVTGDAYLFVQSGLATRSQLRIGRAPVQIGRDPRNTMPFPADSQVSRRHAEIRREPSGYVLYDLGSQNGTFVNGARVSQQIMRDGDQIRVGQSTIRFQISRRS